jgi:hypothetical protein
MCRLSDLPTFLFLNAGDKKCPYTNINVKSAVIVLRYWFWVVMMKRQVVLNAVVAGQNGL